jgi:hypothetical protein
LVGSIALATNYTGRFELNGITNFTGFIGPVDRIGFPFTVPGYDPETVELSSVPGLTSFVMEDLIYMDSASNQGGIFFQNVSALTKVSVPKATYIQQIIIANFPGTSFDFSGLTNCSLIQITGDKITRYVLFLLLRP